ncbi:nucleosome assembly protein 1;4-like protein [Tanacetum coccineum]
MRNVAKCASIAVAAQPWANVVFMILASKLNNLSGQHPDFLETLSANVMQRVGVLKDLQSQHDELEAKYLEEKAELEAKYLKLYELLYAKENNESTGDKGVPNFWLTAMKSNDVLADEISESDEGALQYLKDVVVQSCWTEIDWYPGKKLTQKVLRKKPKKGTRSPKPPITKTENCESFFNFFNPPQIPDDEEEIDEDTADLLQNKMEQDYDIGSTIQDKIIPHAVSWFTGEADENDEYDIEDDDDEDDEEPEDNDIDDDDDEEDEEDVNTKKKKAHFMIHNGKSWSLTPLLFIAEKDPKRKTLFKELEEEENLMKQCIEKLKIVESKRVALVLHLCDALNDQDVLYM